MNSVESCPKDNSCWKELHEWFVCNAKGKEADVLFIGGDHIALLEQSQFYLENLAPLHCLCFGSLGDTAANLLWRVQNGEAENFTPKVIVVSIGQSDGQDNGQADNSATSPSQLISALRQIAEALKERQPQAEIFFLELLPSGRRENPRRTFVSETNSKMESSLKDVASVIYVDSKIIEQNGEIDAHHMFDFVHLSQAGYQIVFEPVLTAINSVFNL